jgi:hypothetical protein
MIVHILKHTGCTLSPVHAAALQTKLTPANSVLYQPDSQDVPRSDTAANHTYTGRTACRVGQAVRHGPGHQLQAAAAAFDYPFLLLRAPANIGACCLCAITAQPPTCIGPVRVLWPLRIACLLQCLHQEGLVLSLLDSLVHQAAA